ncbi:saccharopine dehydrogenase NADP-binding domain-containing protein [Algiphilus sp.]|uniref:saccharopine dehydrogenase NADP-binding domain-containing protein n=1 Tax=Algiphilus sp. TaxID=1872431 RepID=UPI003C65BF71
MAIASGNRPSVLVVGGYGVVGTQATRLLAERNPGIDLLVGGRDAERADALARELPSARGVVVDLTDADPLHRLPHAVDAVLCAANDPDDRLLRACVRHGTALIDITRWSERVRDGLARLPAERAPRAPVVFASSWMAAVPATLAVSAARAMASVSRIEMDVLYALADRAGPDSTAYMDQLGTAFAVTEQGRPAMRPPLSDPKRVDFGGGQRARTRLFDTPDLMTLPATTGAATVKTRIAFDDALATVGLAFLVRSGIWSLIDGERFTPLRRRLLYAPGEGDHHRVRVTIAGRSADGSEIAGRIDIDDPAGQTHLTATGAAVQVERVLGLHGHARAAAGAQYAEAITDAAPLLAALDASGIRVAGDGLPADAPAAAA